MRSDWWQEIAFNLTNNEPRSMNGICQFVKGPRDKVIREVHRLVAYGVLVEVDDWPNPFPKYQLNLEFDSQFENQPQRDYSQVLKNQFVLTLHHCLKSFQNLL